MCLTVDFRVAMGSLSRGLNIAQMQLMTGWFLGCSHFSTRFCAHTITHPRFGQLLFTSGATVP